VAKFYFVPEVAQCSGTYAKKSDFFLCSFQQNFQLKFLGIGDFWELDSEKQTSDTR